MGVASNRQITHLEFVGVARSDSEYAFPTFSLAALPSNERPTNNLVGANLARGEP